MDIANLHVLVVDDFPAMRKLLLKSLRQMGVVNLLEAGDGVDAVKLLESDRVDLLISDWNMPDMGGLELLRWVRQKFTTARLPFLMVTTKGQQMDVVEAVKAGVDAYIVKPFTQEILEGKMTRLVLQAAEFAAARSAALAAEAEAEARRAEESRQTLAELLEEPAPPRQEAAPAGEAGEAATPSAPAEGPAEAGSGEKD
ncbi:MAG: response regulator [Pseudomonadota bacterium]